MKDFRPEKDNCTSKAADLKPGDLFKLKGQRKFREISTITKIKPNDKVPESSIGRLIIMDTNCKQLLLHPDTEVITSNQ